MASPDLAQYLEGSRHSLRFHRGLPSGQRPRTPRNDKHYLLPLWRTLRGQADAPPMVQRGNQVLRGTGRPMRSAQATEDVRE